MTNVLQLYMPLDGDLLRRQERAEDFSERAHGWQLGTMRLPVDVETGRPLDDLVGGAEARAKDFTGGSVRKQAAEVLSRVRATIASFDTATLPALNAYESEDGSATLEWRLPGRRFAFTLERDPQESAWHLVSSQESGGAFAVGKIEHLDLRRMLALVFAQDPR